MRAFELGATGYLVKNSWFDNFPEAVLQVVNEGLPSCRVWRAGFCASSSLEGANASAAANHHKLRALLFEREKSVLMLVAAGHTSIHIGTRLCISSQTVNTY